MTTNINNFFGKAIPYLLLANVFFIPINIKIAIPFISVIAFAWLLSGDWLDIKDKVRGNALIILLASFWGLHVIGLSYTQNMYYGLVDLQHKLSFIVFPIFFLSSSHRILPFKKWFSVVFVLGSVVAGITLLANAFYMSTSVVLNQLIFNPVPYDAWWENYFRYDRLSVFHHTSYLAMYFTFSIAILFGFIKQSKSKSNVILNVLGIIFLYVLIILLSSRAGILIGTLTLIIGMIWLFFRKFKTVILIISFVFLTFSAYMFIHYNERFNLLNENIEAIVDEEETVENNKPAKDMRIQIWSSIPNIIGNNWVFGFGTGDTKDELISGYKRLGLTNACEKQYNAHNQYLETLLAQGIFGFVLLLILLLFPIYRYYKTGGDFLPIILLGIVILNLLFESMLVRISGVMFFAVFYCLFFFNTPKPGNRFD